jgi:hypothetical protein
LASIYSKTLGQGGASDHAIAHVIYTVPPDAGPAVVKSISMTTTVGAAVEVWATLPGGGVGYIGQSSYEGTDSVHVETVQLYQPLEPGTTITAINNGTTGSWTVICGGYQFATP